MVFGAPILLLGLLTLPVIWWLLRLTPPKPQSEVFPPLRLLAKLIKQEETPAQSPWWLTLLRLAMAALVIMAVARPLLNPDRIALSGDGPLLVMLDNGWAHPDQWEERVALARRAIEEAAANNRPVAITQTVASRTANVALVSSDQALDSLAALTPIAASPNRVAALQRLLTALDGADPATSDLVVISDGIAHSSQRPQGAENDNLSARLESAGLRITTIYADNRPLRALADASNGTQSLTVDVATLGSAPDISDAFVSAFDERGRLVAQTQTTRNEETGQIVARFVEPFQLRNDFAWLAIDGERHAGAIHLLDDSDRRRRVGLVSGLSADNDQPLLSPLFYIRRAIEPFTDIIVGRTSDLAVDIPEMLSQGPAVLIMADIGSVPPQTEQTLAEWIDAGGTLVRFAGPRLASQSDIDPFLPVNLRLGERSLTGALSWTEPQPIAPFPSNSPFADLPAPTDVTVNRQILAEPDGELNERTWAILTDGTPLVTGTPRGRGSIVLFHVTAEATWSNLPISGTFVQMLRRIADAATNTGASTNATQTNDPDLRLAPSRILSADGQFRPADGTTEPITIDRANTSQTAFEHPAGLYGTDGSFAALNALASTDELQPISIPASTTTLPYPTQTQTSLAPWLLMAALVLLFVDTLAVMWINGRLAGLKHQHVGRRARVEITALATLIIAIPAADSFAQDSPVFIDENTAITMTSATRIAYVITGVTTTDETSRAGLDGLSRFIASRTALEPGAPVGVDLETDELAFFPLIYYPIDVDADQPSDAAMARLDAYMQSGGSVLFDTRDALMSAFDGQTPENAYLRALIADLNIPALEPVPPDHVLTRSFYILNSFPGRYEGSPLWVEAAPEPDNQADRPVRSGDGVSPVLITGNDLAASWALDETGRPMAAMSGGDPLQRIYAFRVGVNIMMYMLTGNYKADQVHIPALLERLGQ